MAEIVDVPDLQPLKSYTAQRDGSVVDGDLGVIENTPPQGAKKQAPYIAKAAVPLLTMQPLQDPGHCGVESPSGYSGSPMDGTFALNPPTSPPAQNYPGWIIDVDDPSTPGQVIPPDGGTPPPPLPTIGTVTITGPATAEVGDAVTLTASRSGDASVTWSWTPPAGSLVTPSTTNVQSIPVVAETDTGTWTATATEAEETSDGPTKSGTHVLTVTVAPPVPTIGTVTVTGGGTVSEGDAVTLSASISGNATDVVWSWAAPTDSLQTPPGDSATWAFTAATTDTGTFTATATSATASDSPQSGTAALTVNPASGYDPDAQAYIDRVEAADGEELETAVKDAINQFVVDLKNASVNFWAPAQFIWLGGPMRTFEASLIPLRSTGNFNGYDLVANNVTSDRYDRIYGHRCADVESSGLDTSSNVVHPATFSTLMATAYRNIESTSDGNIINSWRGGSGQNYRGMQMSANSFIGQTKQGVSTVKDNTNNYARSFPSKTVQEEPLDIASAVWPSVAGVTCTAVNQEAVAAGSMSPLPWDFKDYPTRCRIGGDSGWTANVPISGNIGFSYWGFGSEFDNGNEALLQEFNAIFTTYINAIDAALSP